jgi:hypothetical protein
MADKLFVSVLGHRDSGKSRTWNTLFGKTVKTGSNSRPLEVMPGKYVDVFLVSGSPEERGKYVGEIITEPNSRIVLCSVQYIESATDTYTFAINHGFEIHTQWLNPGRHDNSYYFDSLGFVNILLTDEHTLSIRDGKVDPTHRVREIRDKIIGWAMPRGLIR